MKSFKIEKRLKVPGTFNSWEKQCAMYCWNVGFFLCPRGFLYHCGCDNVKRDIWQRYFPLRWAIPFNSYLEVDTSLISCFTKIFCLVIHSFIEVNTTLTPYYTTKLLLGVCASQVHLGTSIYVAHLLYIFVLYAFVPTQHIQNVWTIIGC